MRFTGPTAAAWLTSTLLVLACLVWSLLQG